MLNSNSLMASLPQQLPQGLRAVTLVRVSTAEQATEGRSGLDRQRNSDASVVKAFGYSVVKAIEIVDVSGSSSFACPEMIQRINGRSGTL